MKKKTKRSSKQDLQKITPYLLYSDVGKALRDVSTAEMKKAVKKGE